MTLSFVSIYLLTVTVATITPGPSMLLALNHGMRFGWRRAIGTASGNVCATAVQCAISLAGLGLVLAKIGWVFSAIRYAGAAYLVWLGLKMFFSDSGVHAGTSPTVRRSLFVEAFFVTMGNPKAIFFFSALFPQFIDDSTLTWARAGWMVASVLLITFASMMVYALVGQRIQGAILRRGVLRAFNRVVGATFVGLGLGLAFERK